MGIEMESSEINERENLTVAISTNSNTQIDIQITIESQAIDTSGGNNVIYAAILLILLNAFIISEVDK